MTPVTRDTEADSTEEQKAGNEATNIAQALKDLASGEKAATALEANLKVLEDKLDDMLASLGEGPRPPSDTTQETQVNGDQPAKDGEDAKGKKTT